MKTSSENYDFLAENAEAQPLEHITREFNRVSVRVIAICWAVAGFALAGVAALLIWGGK